MFSVAQVQEEAVPPSRSRLARVIEFWSRVRNHVWRAVYLLGVLTFLLPFVTVKGCSSGEVTDYRGFELIAYDFTSMGWVFLMPVCMGLAFLGLSFVRRRRYGQILLGFLKGWRAVFASIAAFVVLFFTLITFLFDEVTPRIGYLLGGTCWSLVYLAGLVGAFVHLWKVGRSRASPPYRASRAIVALRVLHYLVAACALYGGVLPAFIFDEGALLCTLVGLFFLSIPVFLALHFGAEGIRVMERWALAWGVLLSFCLLATGIVSSVIAVRTNEAIWLALLVPVTCFVAVALGAALSTLRVFARARTQE